LRLTYFGASLALLDGCVENGEVKHSGGCTALAVGVLGTFIGAVVVDFAYARNEPKRPASRLGLFVAPAVTGRDARPAIFGLAGTL
jgi:hypothetical protein